MAHVLLIDDDPVFLPEQVRQAFPAPHHRVTAVATGAGGIEHVRAGSPDVILLDLRLPDQSGLAVFEQVRAIDARIPVIFITAAKIRMTKVLGRITVLLATAGAACTPARANSNMASSGKPTPQGPLPAVVLVHGGFVDGSGWEGVYRILKHDGYQVSVVQNPTVTLADDVAVTRRAIDAQSGSVVLVGHSYGGAVVSEAGNDPKVAALVYITAFAPDKGESVQTLIANPPPGVPVPPILPPQDGFLLLDRSKFAASFAADVSPDLAAFIADSQVPWGVQALAGAVTTPAWKAKPSFYLVATSDKMIPPPAQRQMAKRAGATVVETEGSHAVYVSKPDAVASLIEQAAASTSAK